MSFFALKERHRNERASFHTNLSLRVHRALSWLDRAERSDDDDSRFIFLWISFNAAYATEIDDRYRQTEKDAFTGFFQKLVDLDQDNQLYELIWSEFSGGVRSLLDNQFVFQPFWDYHNGKISESEWQCAFNAAKKAAGNALGARDTVKVLSVVFTRIYTLRNQMIHGGATWNSQVNRAQVRDGSHFLNGILVKIVGIMIDHPDALWGDPYYPVVS